MRPKYKVRCRKCGAWMIAGQGVGNGNYRFCVDCKKKIKNGKTKKN